ncbi:MAG: S-ribosylhomocysteine lyase, partial [Vallitaleaceae bacterium]|nr:S-ribosylhomocysteine lyase [Vallitaleaceae bacterium]
MEKIASFTVDHIRLLKGVYISRQDFIADQVITTYDLRMKKPNEEPVMNTAEIHAIEHLGATYLRNRDDIKADVIYYGPMGCRTGFYLILKGSRSTEELLP